MPLARSTKNGKPCYKWGKKNPTCYTFKSGDKASRERAKNKAKKQGRAIKSEEDEE